jgi:hypothetical protein
MRETQATITIVGAGLSGRSIAVQQAWHYAELKKERPDLPPLHIRLIDGAGGAGPAYETKDDAFLLNQPASAMSPFPQDPGHFTRWLGGTGNEFATRAQYGAYLKSLLPEAFTAAARAGVPVKCEEVRANVFGLALTEDAATVFTSRGVHAAEALVLATGHARGAFLRGLEGEKGFFSTPYTSEDVKAALLEDRHGAVAIAGSGACALDALGALDRAGYKGDIHVISRNLVEPWAYHPGHYNDNRPAYLPHFLAPEYARENGVARGALEQEIARGRAQGYDVGHVLAAIDFDALEGVKGVKELRALWAHYYGNPAPPSRVELYEGYKEQGRLHLVKAEVREDKVEKIRGGWRVAGLEVSALFNCAGVFTRDPLASPLLRQAEREGALRHSFNAAVAPGAQKHPLLFVAGPAVSPDKWGVETFRDNNFDVAKRSVGQALHAFLPNPQTKGNHHVR